MAIAQNNLKLEDFKVGICQLIYRYYLVRLQISQFSCGRFPFLGMVDQIVPYDFSHCWAYTLRMVHLR